MQGETAVSQTTPCLVPVKRLRWDLNTLQTDRQTLHVHGEGYSMTPIVLGFVPKVILVWRRKGHAPRKLTSSNITHQ